MIHSSTIMMISLYYDDYDDIRSPILGSSTLSNLFPRQSQCFIFSALKWFVLWFNRANILISKSSKNKTELMFQWGRAPRIRSGILVHFCNLLLFKETCALSSLEFPRTLLISFGAIDRFKSLNYKSVSFGIRNPSLLAGFIKASA